jgi:hypothetical protein
MSPFFIRNRTIARFIIVFIRNWIEGFKNWTKPSNCHIFTHLTYFTQMTNESQIFTQIATFSHIEHISHKYPMKINFSHKWPYFYTLSIFHINIQWKSFFHTNGHIFTHWAYFTQMTNESQIFTKMAIFSHIEHILRNHFATFRCGLGFLKFLTFHGGHCASMKLRWSMVFLAWSSRWRKEESHQNDQTFPHRWHSRLRWFIIFQV